MRFWQEAAAAAANSVKKEHTCERSIFKTHIPMLSAIVSVCVCVLRDEVTREVEN